MNLKNLSNTELLGDLRRLRNDERSLNLKIIEYICEVESRMLFAEIGYPSVYEWLVKDLGYSEGSAYRRVMAARALRRVPEVASKIEDGRLTLVALAKVQSAIRSEERRTGEVISAKAHSLILEKAENKTTRETEKIIALAFPESRTISNSIRRQLELSEELSRDLERVRELKSHSNFGASLEDVVSILVLDYLDRNDPLRRDVKPRAKKTPAENPTEKLTETPTENPTVKKRSVAKRRAIAPAVVNWVRRRAQDACEFESKNGRRCGSRFQVEVDHIRPVAIGGDNEVSNLRVLCRIHNDFEAKRVLGPLGRYYQS